MLLLTGCEPAPRSAAPTPVPTRAIPSARQTSAPIKATAQPPTATDVVPTATSSATPSPSPEPAPTKASAEACSNAVQFEIDVSIPDNTIVPPGQAFVKTWRLRNTGTCTWSTSYKLVRDSGETLGSLASVTLPRAVERDNTVDISVQLVAPTTPNTYTGYWQLADASSRRFGPKTRVVIVVPDPTLGEQLPETLTFMGGAGGGTTKDSCVFDAKNARGQSVTVNPRWMREQGTQLCIYGLPVYSTAKVTLVSPSGVRFVAQFDVGGILPDFTWTGGARTVVGVPLAWPATTVAGVWQLSVQGDGLRHDTNISVSTSGRGGTELRASPLDSFNPFDTLDSGPLGYTLSYPIGERVQFIGSGFSPNARIPLGIYREVGPGDSSLVHSEVVVTDRVGGFKMAYRIPDTLPVGKYWAVAGSPKSWTSMAGMYDILGREGTTHFYIRGGAEDPAPSFEVFASQPTGEPLRIVLEGINLGRSVTRGASLTVSSPDAARMMIEDADVPIIEPSRSNCDVATPHAWVLGPQSPCNRAMQYNTNCKGTAQLSALMAEGWYRPWATGETQRLTVRLWPLPGRREVRLYARMAMLAGAAGCRIVTAPEADKSDGTDQQGFPVQVVTVPIR